MPRGILPSNQNLTIVATGAGDVTRRSPGDGHIRRERGVDRQERAAPGGRLLQHRDPAAALASRGHRRQSARGLTQISIEIGTS